MLGVPSSVGHAEAGKEGSGGERPRQASVGFEARSGVEEASECGRGLVFPTKQCSRLSGVFEPVGAIRVRQEVFPAKPSSERNPARSASCKPLSELLQTSPAPDFSPVYSRRPC